MKRQPLALTTAGDHYLTSCQIEENPLDAGVLPAEARPLHPLAGRAVADLGLERERKFVRRPEPLGA